MTWSIPVSNRDEVSLEDYIAYIQAKVDLQNPDSIAASAPLLRSLANDRQLLVRRLNELVLNGFTKGSLPSAQSVLLGSGKGFYVRANIWPSSADVAHGRLYQDRFAYNLAHDHNFSFLTVNYLGSGYETDLYDYDYESIEGFPGEPVDLRFIQRARFGPDLAMLYMASKDVHVQYPPNDLSISLNLMIASDDYQLREQHFFDLERKILLQFSPDTPGSHRNDLLAMAGAIGDARTGDLLKQLAHKHAAPRTRLAALQALKQLNPTEAVAAWKQACSDPAPLVSKTACAALNGKSLL